MFRLLDATDVEKTENGDEQKPASSWWSDKRRVVGCGAVVIVCAFLVPFWFSFEHRIPTIDESGHILNAFTYADLFKHPQFFRGRWWHDLLSVNCFYPPFAHMTNGLFKAMFGSGRAVDIAALTAFNVVLTTSVYGIAWRLTRSAKAAIFSACIVNLYPEIALINRAFWLDFPLTAMVSLALFALLLFRDKPTWRSAVLAGFALGSACMTKQIAVTYLVLPAVAVFTEQLLGKGKSFSNASKLCVTAIITALLSAPWFVLNAGKAKVMADECAANISHAQSFTDNLFHYVQVLPSTMSPLLVAALLCAVCALGKAQWRNLYLLALSAGGGVLAVCTLTWITPKPQYIAPALISAAVITASALARLVESPNPLAKRVGLAALTAAVLQLFSLLFSPYPLAKPEWLANFGRALGNTIAEPRLGITLVNPRSPTDWGQDWTLDQIVTVDKGSPVYLNVLSNSPDINVHTFELLVHERNCSVVPTTSREYTIGGDVVKFSPAKALYYQWYLIPSENHYQGFVDSASAKAFDELKHFVQTGTNFRQVGTHALPDGTSIALYRQK